MLGHTQGAAYDQLAELAPHPALCPSTAASTDASDHSRALGSSRASGSMEGTQYRQWPPVVRHCDEFRPEPWIIEAFARIAAGDRLRALAFRLELGAGTRWRCAAIDLGPSPGQPPGQQGPTYPRGSAPLPWSSTPAAAHRSAGP
ncbi:Rv3235 family protein [Streptomyces zagrosensis]|uniref:Uncharacterized protein n=2 Tax=Streptomyces zagrosensis TaxID=1042984 RepID=A0A7W9Q8W8_9ACTN|nr:Rv3235 family protein [Streptomyces zagrosensis]MBB5935293.1 hypothetical protein [Streptomyces zagrosensis]